MVQPKHIDPIEAAQYLGIELTEGHLDGATARLYRIARRARIRISDRLTLPGRRRFSIAHEIGHYVLGHAVGGDAWTPDSGNRSPDDERDADAFAVEYLTPEVLVRPYCHGPCVGLPRVREISRVFRTSPVASAFRFVELSTEPCAAVYSIPHVAEWVKRSGRFELPIAERRGGFAITPAASLVTHVPAGVELMAQSEHVAEPGASGALSLLWIDPTATRAVLPDEAAGRRATEVRPSPARGRGARRSAIVLVAPR